MKINYLICFILLSLLSCKNDTSGYHNGKYVFADTIEKNLKEESIIINGNSATLYLRSFINKSKLKKSKLLCIQHPNRIDLPMRDGRPITINVDKDGNLLIDGNLFKKEPFPVIIETPIPAAFF